MKRYGSFRKKTLFYVLIGIITVTLILVVRLFWLMVIQKDNYEYRAQALHERAVRRSEQSCPGQDRQQGKGALSAGY